MLLLLPLPSWAGHWVITMVGATNVPGGGTGTYTFANGQVTGPAPFPMSFDPQFHPMLTLHASDCDLVYLDNGDINMSVIVKLTWTPDWVPPPGVDNSQPPPTVDVLETASAGSGVGLNQPTSVSTTADDGLGDAQTYPAPSYYGAQCSGKHLFHLVVPAGQMSVTLPTRSLSASLSWLPSSANTGGPGMSVNYAVQKDTRAVTISAGVDATLGKGPRHDESGTDMYNIYGDQMFTPHPHSREPDGTMRGDIGIPDTDGGSYNYTDITYSAGRTGSWSLDGDTDFWYHGLISDPYEPDHLSETITSYSPNISDFTVRYNGYWTGKVAMDSHNVSQRSTIGTDHVFFSYVDGHDQAKATANYYMTVHQPYEYVLSKKPAEADWRPVPITIDPNQNFGNDSTCSFTYNADNPMVAEVTFDGTGKTATVGALTVAGAATTLPWLNALLTAGAFGLDKFGPVPAHGTADFVQCFESNYSTFNKPRPADYFSLSLDEKRKARALYTIQPYFFVRYTKTYYAVDTWDWKGYAGQQYRMLETLDQSTDGSPAATQPLGAFTFDSSSPLPSPAVPVFPGT